MELDAIKSHLKMLRLAWNDYYMASSKHDTCASWRMYSDNIFANWRMFMQSFLTNGAREKLEVVLHQFQRRRQHWLEHGSYFYTQQGARRKTQSGSKPDTADVNQDLASVLSEYKRLLELEGEQSMVSLLVSASGAIYGGVPSRSIRRRKHTDISHLL